jgi:glycosyltransferase 2 family protein
MPLRRWVRIGVSTAMLAALLSFIPMRQLGHALARVPAGVLFATLVVLIGGHVAAALKWRLLQGGNTDLEAGAAIRAHFHGVLANLWLPGVVGGDLVRAGVTARHASRPALVVLASLIDRIVDSFGLVSIAFVGLLLIGGQSREAWHLVVVVFLVGLVGALAVYGGYRYVRARPTHRRFVQLIEAIDLMACRPGLVVLALIISIAVQAAFILINVTIGRAVGMTAPVAVWFMAWPLAKLAALVPISAAGLGVREAALIVLMRPFGDPPETIMAAGLVWQAAFIAGGAIGGTVFFLIPGPAPFHDDGLEASAAARNGR